MQSPARCGEVLGVAGGHEVLRLFASWLAPRDHPRILVENQLPPWTCASDGGSPVFSFWFSIVSAKLKVFLQQCKPDKTNAMPGLLRLYDTVTIPAPKGKQCARSSLAPCGRRFLCFDDKDDDATIMMQGFRSMLAILQQFPTNTNLLICLLVTVNSMRKSVNLCRYMYKYLKRSSVVSLSLSLCMSLNLYL